MLNNQGKNTFGKIHLKETIDALVTFILAN